MILFALIGASLNLRSLGSVAGRGRILLARLAKWVAVGRSLCPRASPDEGSAARPRTRAHVGIRRGLVQES